MLPLLPLIAVFVNATTCHTFPGPITRLDRIHMALGLVQQHMTPHEEAAHGWAHSFAVYRNARLATQELSWYDAPIELIWFAALLHDVDDYKIFGGQTHHAARIMQQVGLCDQEIADVLEMISLVSASANGNRLVEPRWKLIPRDCDRIEALGIGGIQRCLDYGLSVGRLWSLPQTLRPHTLEELDAIATPDKFDRYRGDTPNMIDHYYASILHLGRMSSGLKSLELIAAERTLIMRHFVLIWLHVIEPR